MSNQSLAIPGNNFFLSYSIELNQLNDFNQKIKYITDKLFKILKKSESIILQFLIRKLDGFNKSVDYIAFSQFKEFTGLADKTIRTALKNLEKNGFIISWLKKDGLQKRYYFVNTPIMKKIVAGLKTGSIIFKDFIKKEQNFWSDTRYIKKYFSGKTQKQKLKELEKKKTAFYTELINDTPPEKVTLTPGKKYPTPLVKVPPTNKEYTNKDFKINKQYIGIKKEVKNQVKKIVEKVKPKPKNKPVMELNDTQKKNYKLFVFANKKFNMNIPEKIAVDLAKTYEYKHILEKCKLLKAELEKGCVIENKEGFLISAIKNNYVPKKEQDQTGTGPKISNYEKSVIKEDHPDRAFYEFFEMPKRKKDGQFNKTVKNWHFLTVNQPSKDFDIAKYIFENYELVKNSQNKQTKDNFSVFIHELKKVANLEKITLVLDAFNNDLLPGYIRKYTNQENLNGFLDMFNEVE